MGRILDLGVGLELNSEVTNVVEAIADGGFDAAFLAVGAQIGKRAYVPAGSAAHVLDAVSMLHDMEATSGRCWSPGRRLWRWGHGDGRGSHRQAPRCG